MSNYDDAGVGYEILQSQGHRGWELFRRVIGSLVGIQIVIMCIALFVFFRGADFKIAASHICSGLGITKTVTVTLSDFNLLKGNREPEEPRSSLIRTEVDADKYHIASGPYFAWFLRRLTVIFLSSFGTWLLYWPCMVYFRDYARNQSKHKHISGPQFISIQALKRELARAGKKAMNFRLLYAKGNPERIKQLPVEKLMMQKTDSLDIPFSVEPNQFAILGSPNQGKSTLFKQMLDSIEGRPYRAVILDPHGEYAAHYYRPNRGHVIFNPLDARSQGHGWTVWNDVSYETDFDKIADIIIPPNPRATDPTWDLGDRELFSALLRTLTESGEKTNRAIWNALSSGAEGLAMILQRSEAGKAAAAAYLANPDDRMSQSYVAGLKAHTGAFQYLNDGDFSIREWLASKKQGWIFITAKDRFMPTLRPILTLFTDMFCSALLDLEPSRSRRIYLFLDEFPVLSRIPSLQGLPAQGRKFGGIVVLGAQGLTQIEERYGKEGAREILGSLRNGLYFAVDGDTARWIAEKRIGEWEYSYQDISTTQGDTNKDKQNRVTTMPRRKKELLIYPALIMHQKILEAYVQFHGYDISQCRFVPQDRPMIAKDFIPTQGLDINALNQQQDTVQDEIQSIYAQLARKEKK